MKSKIYLTIAFILGAFTIFAQADAAKLRQKQQKITASELNAKASKSARTEAKKLSKQGWLVSPGALPIDKQLDRSYTMQYEIDESGFPKYIMAEAQTIGEVYDAAKMQAVELSKQLLAGQIQTEVVALIENTVANKQLSDEQAATIAESVSSSKNFITQSLGRQIPIVELYRILPNKNREVLVRLAYNSEMAIEIAKKAIRADLEKKGDKLHEQLDELFK